MSSIPSSSSPNSGGNSEKNNSEHAMFSCSAPGCHQTFSSSSDLAIHKQKHQMTLKLGPSKTGLADMLPFDQTPTPTKFLQYGKETGLFDEISNPFDSEFKRGTSGSLKDKARRSAVPQLIINNGMNKARTPTSYPSCQGGMVAPVAQPVHVITLTPTLPSPVGALPGSQFFIPPLPSPQGFIPGLAGLSATSPLAGPATLISPSIVPFSAPGLAFPNMQAVVEAQQAALTQAFINAAAANAATSQSFSQSLSQSVLPDSSTHSQGHGGVSRTASLPVQASATTNPFPTQTVSVPVNHNPPAPSSHHSGGPSMAAAPIGSASVIQQHGQLNMESQRRSLSQSNSLDLPPSHPNPSNLERKSSFPGETSVITQTPNPAVTSQMNSNINLNASSMPYQYMGQQQQQPNMSHFSHNMGSERPSSVSRMITHPVLTTTRSVPTTQVPNDINMALTHQNSLPNMDAKQKLKETLTNNNPNLQMEIPQIKYDIDSENSQNEVSSSSGTNGKTPGRRRGRQQSEVDPDKKRMRFLERNRAAASRCRAKKKQWVCGLEVKAKELNVSNITLQNEVASLREEVASLKQLLLAHRDCPITRIQQQKLIVAGGDPSTVVTNPIQAAASLLGISSDDQSINNDSASDDVKPNLSFSDNAMHQALGYTSSTGSVGEDGHNNVQSVVGKTEPIENSFPTAMTQASIASTIVMNDSFSNSNSSLSSSAST